MNVLKPLLSIIRTSNQPWWVKVRTQGPDCTYYFGPFESKSEAKLLQAGYLEDLMQEGAQNIKLAVERARPKNLTSCTFE